MTIWILRTNYSLLVIRDIWVPNKVVEKWAKIAHDNKVMIYTDFADLEKPMMSLKCSLIQSFQAMYVFNVCMTCKLSGRRGRYAEQGETEDLLISSPSGGHWRQCIQDGNGTGYRR